MGHRTRQRCVAKMPLADGHAAFYFELLWLRSKNTAKTLVRDLTSCMVVVVNSKSEDTGALLRENLAVVRCTDTGR